VAHAVICAACGAKVRGDRERCPRCREPLVARQQPAGASAGTSNRWVTVGIVAGCVAVGGFSIVLLNGGKSQPVVSTTRAATASGQRATVPVRLPSDVEPAAVAAAPAVATAGLVGGERAYNSGDFDESLEAYQATVAEHPNDPRALNNLGQLLVRLGRAQEAIPYFDKAVLLMPDTWAYQFNRARAYAQLKQWDAAIGGYQRARQLFPDDYATQYNLAKALQASGDVKAALPAYERAIALAPGQPDFQISYGLALEAASRPQDAAAAYRRYLELQPDSADTEKIKAHLAELAGK
jgi:tetratricopeptide (TPR) repeat protein